MSTEIEILKNGANGVISLSEIDAIVQSDLPDSTKDIAVARHTMTDVLKKAETLLENACILARDSDDPKAYAAATRVMDSIAKTAALLVSLHETEASRKAPKAAAQNIEVKEKTTYIGSPADLMKMFEQQSAREQRENEE